MYMNVASAKCKYPIYQSHIFFSTMITFIVILDYCSNFTQIASANYLNPFQIKCGLISISLLKQ